MIIPEWIGLLIVSLVIILFVCLLTLFALIILTEAIEVYFKRLITQLGHMDARQFAKEYREWKKQKDEDNDIHNKR